MIEFSLLNVIVMAGAASAIDWAIVDRTVHVVYIFFENNKEYSYKKFLYPRIIFQISAALVFLYGMYADDDFGVYEIIGVSLFIFFSLYPSFFIFMKKVGELR